MRDPWNVLTRRDGGPSRLRLWAATAGSAVAGIALVATLVVALTGLSTAGRAAVPALGANEAEVAALHHELDVARTALTQVEGRLERVTTIARYSALYDVPADLASAIYDNAVAEGIHPSLGFQLVKVESGFKASALSNRGAIGYTQLRLKTARIYDPKITERELADRDTNLRIGFRFLKDLMGQFDEDLHMALVAYNRGPSRVVEMMTRGEDPANGYAEVVLRGVKKGS
ncbi:MAG TPA: transglycosylase SLT domain-containing protein [Gemmatimonadales bacterium]|nr:transglycosylase SLT domain-containing protein [Gemmatimonadales bacterium]